LPISPKLRSLVMQQAQGMLALQVAFVGVANDLFLALHQHGPATPAGLATATGLDVGYLERWCDVAYATGYLDEQPDGFELTELGHAFRSDLSDSLWPVAMGPVLGGHMADRAATCMRSGERPGEGVLSERPVLAEFFGPMLETRYGGLFRAQILDALHLFGDVDTRGGLVVDLGCGNGWYLRALAERFPRLRGLGLDGMPENIDGAVERARAEGVDDRLAFRLGDLHTLALDEPVSAFVMNRALHHVWDGRRALLRAMVDRLEPGGSVVIWEPRWPDERAALRAPPLRAMAWQNLAEHVQGNRFLRPAEIEAEYRAVGLEPRTLLFAGGNEAVVVGTLGGSV
jgi:SAM-dependent methyltransferase